MNVLYLGKRGHDTYRLNFAPFICFKLGRYLLAFISLERFRTYQHLPSYSALLFFSWFEKVVTLIYNGKQTLALESFIAERPQGRLFS